MAPSRSPSSLLLLLLLLSASSPLLPGVLARCAPEKYFQLRECIEDARRSFRTAYGGRDPPAHLQQVNLSYHMRAQAPAMRKFSLSQAFFCGYISEMGDCLRTHIRPCDEERYVQQLNAGEQAAVNAARDLPNVDFYQC